MLVRQGICVSSVSASALSLVMVVLAVTLVSVAPASPLDAVGSQARAPWSELAVYQGEITAIAGDPGSSVTFYAGTLSAGIFKTTDGGDTWVPSRSGLSRYPIISLAVDPLSSSKILAGTDDDGIWRSSDGGASWTATSGIELDMEILNIVYHPLTPQIVYAGSRGYSAGNIYKSTDGGATWSVSDDGTPGSAGSHTDSVLSLAIDPADPSYLLAGIGSYGVYSTSNGGTSWTALCAGLPNDGTDYDPVSAIAFSPHDDRPWAIVSTFDGGLFRFDETDTWVKVSGSYEVYGGYHLDFMPDDANDLFATGGTAGHCEKSTDGGVTWDWSLGHPESGDVAGIAFHPTLPNDLLAAGGVPMSGEPGGVFRSDNQGLSWTLSSDGITAAELTSVAVDPRNRRHILVGTDEGSLLMSQDGGDTWALAEEALNPDTHSFGFQVSDVVVDPNDGQWIYLAAGSLWASNDGGTAFGEIVEGYHAECLAVAPGATTVVYVGMSFGDGMLRGSATSGWEAINNGLPTCTFGVCSPVSLAVDPSNSQTVWAGLQSEGIAKTTDGGDTWNIVGLPDSYGINAIAVSPTDSSLVIAADNDGKIYKTSIGGGVWQLRYDGDSYVRAFAFHPDEPSWIYAATAGDGILRSTDAGQTWASYSVGIFYPEMTDLAVTDEREPLLLTTSDGSGLYGRRLPVVEDIFSDGFDSGNLSGWSSSTP